MASSRLLLVALLTGLALSGCSEPSTAPADSMPTEAPDFGLAPITQEPAPEGYCEAVAQVQAALARVHSADFKPATDVKALQAAFDEAAAAATGRLSKAWLVVGDFEISHATFYRRVGLTATDLAHLEAGRVGKVSSDGQARMRKGYRASFERASSDAKVGRSGRLIAEKTRSMCGANIADWGSAEGSSAP